MLRDVAEGRVVFDHVVKTYALGTHRAYLSAAWPFGDGLHRGNHLNALDDVSLDIEPGEAFALVGANGAGKSTALKCLAGVVAPTSGRIRRGGRMTALIELGVGFHPDLNGYENARFAAAIAGLRGAAARRAVDAAVEFAQIDAFMSTPVKRYSSGMYARLSFGIAASIPADVLVVDEILAVGDLAFQRKCFAHLAQLRAERGVTLLFVSHNEWVLNEVCTRGALLVQGRVVSEGGISELLRTYRALVSGRDTTSVLATEGARASLHDVEMSPGSRVVDIRSDVEVRFAIDVSGDVEESVVGVSIANADGHLMWAAYTDEHGIGLSPGRHQVSVDIRDVNLLPGSYRLEVSAFARDSPVGDDLRRLEFEVVGEVPTSAAHGLVHLETGWSSRNLNLPE